MGAVWGSLAAVGIGISDLFGRRIVHRVGSLSAAWALQVFGALTALAMLVVLGGEWRTDDMVFGVTSGFGMAGGLGFYYGGIHRSSATVVSPTVATLSAIIPYVWTLFRGANPSTLAMAGAIVAILGLGLVAAGVAEVTHLRAGLAWGIVSGLCYGVGIAVFVEVSDASGAWGAVGQRAGATVALGIAAVAVGARLLPPRDLIPSAVISGIAGGLTSICILIGLRVDAPPTVVTSSMFPLVTVMVGYLSYGDAVGRRQVVGIGLALVGIALVVGA